MTKKSSAADHQKKLGQYFSGEKVGSLLVSLLPEGAEITSVADPMAGTGDLLRAAGSRAAPGAAFLGVEIDEAAAKACAGNLPGCRVVREDAFSSASLRTEEGWDLVITNPPYVRYQLQTREERLSVRARLRGQLEGLSYLDAADRDLFLRLAEGYSGLSDLAVPSWLLCAALVRAGGYLAMVVPETWLSREYAQPVQYLLAKSFDVLTIVRDVSGAWFDSAQVRTCLLAARRRASAPLQAARAKETLCVDLSAEAGGSSSLVDRLSYGGAAGREAFQKLLDARPDCSGPGFAVSTKKTLDLFPYMLSGPAAKKWALPEDGGFLRGDHGRPMELLPVLAGEETAFVSLRELGIQCGQGLRTGANEFFYLRIVKEGPDSFEVRGRAWYGGGVLTVPRRNLVRTLQNRAEAEGLAVCRGQLQTALLLIGNEVRQEDFQRCAPALAEACRPLDEALAAYITAGESYRNSRGAAFREYSAVAPNEKRDGESWTRFWYMLPPLSKRHLPAMCMNRVNAASASCLYVPQSAEEPIAVDANFVTLWGDTPEHEAAGLALLNSTWSKCYLECLCTVMGGGALKVETSHIGKLRFPGYSPLQRERLAACGRRIIAEKTMTEALQAEIDAAVLAPFREPERVLEQLKALLLRRLSERGARL